MNRIIFDCERMKYKNTGLHHYCLNLGNHLKKVARPGAEEFLFYCPQGTEHMFGENSNCVRQSSLHKFRMPSLKDFQVWHATYQDSYYIPFRNKNIKVVLTIHDLNFMYDDHKSEARKKKYLRRLQSLVNRADVITCVSEYGKNDVNDYCEIHDKPLYVIRNGSNSLTEPKLSKYSYKPGRPFIFSLGTITPKKNFHALLPLLKKQDEMELVIAGNLEDIDYYNFILATAESMGLSDKVQITGPVTEQEKSWYFNNCTAFAFPSKAEGFGLPVAEAMSVGKPLFLSHKTALPEIGGDMAFYFNDFSELHMQETFHSGMKEYKKLNMQQDIIKKGKEYCWITAAGEYWQIYRSLF